MKIFSWRHALQSLAGDGPADPEGTGWARDPLSHPDIARMSLSELADLPLGQLVRRGIADNKGAGCCVAG